MSALLGDLMVQRGVLTPDQRDEILEHQGASARPFGLLAEELFGVSPRVVEDAWAEQFALIAPKFDPRHVVIPHDVLGLVDRRQAWQFGVIPVSASGQEVQLVTATPYLPRALRFAGWSIPGTISFAICETEMLATALGIHYPINGLEPGFVQTVMGKLAAG